MNPAWALLRLASPQLPIGGYSYSQGLEMAVDNGRVQDAASARRWISDQLLLNLARFEAPLLLAHCRAAGEQDWAQLAQWCDEHRASRETRELYQESRQMGYSLQQLLNGLPELDDSARDFLAQRDEPHLALGWALAARAWHISADDTCYAGAAIEEHRKTNSSPQPGALLSIRLVPEGEAAGFDPARVAAELAARDERLSAMTTD